MKGRVFTPAMLAERWAVSTSVVRKEIRSGRLKAFQAGVRQWRIRLEDVEEYECPRLIASPDIAGNSPSPGSGMTDSDIAVRLARMTATLPSKS
ncbi:MAG: hypothetical protein FD152_3050 [Xanthobacteraceae bacterium]|nr:MAG: hypothetical protein FD152_3050 [Xanthobacteraceae bacterium]